MLLTTTGCAFVMLLTNFAIQGHLFAISLLAGILSAAALFTIFAVQFGVAYLLSKRLGLRYQPPPTSPFATDALPPQVVPPRDLE
jgi:hypothetical protein